MKGLGLAPTLILASALLVGCRELTERRLMGQWRTESTPERTLDLFADGTYSLRLSGKGLGFVSELKIEWASLAYHGQHRRAAMQ